MKISELRQLIREEVREAINNKNTSAKTGENDIAKTGKKAKTGTYEIRYITDDAGNKLYSVYLSGEGNTKYQFGDRYSGSSTIPSGYKNTTPTYVLQQLLGTEYK